MESRPSVNVAVGYPKKRQADFSRAIRIDRSSAGNPARPK
jgi:hypothetical protein